MKEMTINDALELSKRLDMEAVKAKTSGMPDIALTLHSASISISLMAATYERRRLQEKLQSLEVKDAEKTDEILQRIDLKLDALIARALGVGVNNPEKGGSND